MSSYRKIIILHIMSVNLNISTRLFSIIFALPDLFVGQLKSSLTCSHCGFCSTVFDPFWDLSLPIAKVRQHTNTHTVRYNTFCDGWESPDDLNTALKYTLIPVFIDCNTSSLVSFLCLCFALCVLCVLCGCSGAC